MKFVNKLPGKIGEKLHGELVRWFDTKRTQWFNYHTTLLPVIEFCRGRIKEYCEEEKHRKQIQEQFSKMCIDMYEVPTLGCSRNNKNYRK